jgi:hypothetical protein
VLEGSKEASLKSRIIGIVNRTDLMNFQQPDGSFLIKQTLFDRFEKPHSIKNLPKGFEKQNYLPFGSGIALSEDLILTAGHNTKNSPPNIRIIQYDLNGNKLPNSCVYEVESYINRQDFQVEDESQDPETYANNLLLGEWTIIKLKKPLKQVKGSLSVANDRNSVDFKKGSKTFTLGHPYGIPLKKADGELDETLSDGELDETLSVGCQACKSVS